MSAKLHTVRLFWRSTREVQVDTHIDPTSSKALRALLERLVKEKRGHLRVDLSNFSLTVHTVGGGRRVARCKVTGIGETEVTR